MVSMTTNPPKIFAFILILVMDESIWGQGRGGEEKKRKRGENYLTLIKNAK